MTCDVGESGSVVKCTQTRNYCFPKNIYTAPITLKVDIEKREDILNLLEYYLQLAYRKLLIRPKQN